MANVLKTLKPIMVKHEPDILMYTGLAGFGVTIVLAVKATINAVNLVNARKIELNKEKLSKKEILKTTWKCYIPPVIMAAVSAPCVIMGNHVNNKRNAALAAAYTLSETALQEYQNKAKEIVGERKEQQIREAASKEIVEKSYKPGATMITGNGDSLFYDELSGRYFKSTWNKVLRAANELNADAIGGNDTITINDWFQAIGLEPIHLGEERGWSVYENGAKGLISISLTSILTDDQVPCAAIHYENRPYELK